MKPAPLAPVPGTVGNTFFKTFVYEALKIGPGGLLGGLDLAEIYLTGTIGFEF